MNDETPLTISVQEAGMRYFNLSRDASYAAARRGDIPTIRVGRLLRVPVAAMERKFSESTDWKGLGDVIRELMNKLDAGRRS